MNTGVREAKRVVLCDDPGNGGVKYLCDSGDPAGAIALALALTWYWQMFGRDSDAGYWLGEALAVPGEPTPERDCARAAHLLSRADILSGITAGEAAEDRAEMRELAGRLLAHPRLPGHYRVFGPMLLFLLGDESALVIFRQLADGDDGWLSALAHMFQAEIAENAGELDRVGVHVAAALAGFRRAGDRWGQAATLPMRAQLRRYDELDGALADLREAKARAGEFGSLSISDEIFIDMRWVDLHLRRGDTAGAVAMLESTRERALRSGSVELIFLVDALEAGTWVRIGDLDRAQRMLDRAEAGIAGEPPPRGDHGQALVGAVRATLCLRRGDAAGAEAALARAYAAAVQTHDMPILSIVAVTAAGLAELHGRHHDVAHLLGAAARLRGTHDRTDPHLSAMADRGRAALGEAGFAAAYQAGWQLDGKTASVQIDPARLRQELPGPV